MATTVKTGQKTTKAASNGPINEIVTKIENLTAETSFNEAVGLLDNIESNSFQLGGVLSVIQTNGFFTEKGYENFKDCCEKEFGLKYRKAMYLVGIYNSLVAAEIEWDKVKGLGWTKLKEIAGILTKENVDELVEKASGMTVLQLQEYVEGLNAPSASGDKPAKEKSDVSTMTFKLHADQKATVKDAVEMAKKESGTDVDAVALENIALSYMNTAGNKKGKKEAAAAPVDIKALMKELGYEATLEAFSEVWPEIDLTVSVPETTG